MTHPLEQIEPYIAGGLSAAERAELEAHLETCAACAARLREAEETDSQIEQLFAAVRPAPGFEDRLVQSLRRAPRPRRFVHPLVRRVAVGVAACVTLAGIGYVGNTTMNGGRASVLAVRDDRRQPNLRQIGLLLGGVKQPVQAKIATDHERLAENRTGLSVTRGETSIARKPALADSLAMPQDDKDSVLLPTDDSGGEANATPVPPALTSPAPFHFDQADKAKQQAQASYYSLNFGAERTTPLGIDGSKALDSRGAEHGEPAAMPTAGQAPAAQNVQMGRNNWAAILGTRDRAAGPTGSVVGKPAAAKDSAGAPAAIAAAIEPPKSTSPQQPAPEPAKSARPDPAADRKVIRNGEMEFEVDSFDSAVNQISKIVAEEGGFVSTTESDKLPNGKVRGRVVLRCPPDRLDTLVLKLRGIGDLRTQKIGAQDITKQYTDLESALRAARAMQDRLLEIIKTGKGEVKDLLEAEKQLGTWRERIEQLEGEIRYYNNLVSLSTLSITLQERDIRTPAFASETETVNLALETEKVEDAYQKARDAIADAKGRITASELKQFDAGQYRATVSALLPPDQAEAVIARIRQLEGRLAHFDRQRTQTTSAGEAAHADPLRVKREDVAINLTIYNLANIAPRRTTTLLLVAANVEEAYRTLVDQVNSEGGKVVTSAINRPSPEQTSGTINFNVPAEKADAILAAVRGVGEVLKSDTAVSPDTQSVTESKRGFSLTIGSLDAFRARESQQIQIAAPQVPDAFNELLNAARGKMGRVINSQLNEQDRQNVTGTLEFWVPREAMPTIEQAFVKSGDVVSRVVTRSNDTENTVDTKVQFQVTISSADRLPARETIQAQLAATSVPDAFNAIRGAIPKTGRILVSELNEQDPQNVSARLVFDLPVGSEIALNDVVNKRTALLSRQIKSIPAGQVAVEKVRFEATLISAERQPARQTVRLGVQTQDVEKATDDFLAAAKDAGGKQVDNPSRSEDNAGHVMSVVTVEVPIDKLSTVLAEADRLGSRRQKQMTTDTQVPETRLSRAWIEVSFSNSAANLGGQESLADYLRNGLLTSLKGLGYSLMWIVIGICLVAPWALVIWAAWKLIRRPRRRPGAEPPASPPPTTPVPASV